MDALHPRTLEDLDEVFSALTGGEVAWAVLEGPVLSGGVHERPMMRDTDLDLLVGPSRVQRTVEVLLEGDANVLPVDR